MSKRPSGMSSSRLRRTRPPASVLRAIAIDAGDLGEHVDRDRRGHLRHPAEAALLVGVEQLVGAVHGLREGRRRHHVGDADERDLHRDLLDEQRQPAGGVAAGGVRRRHGRRGRSGCPPAASTRCRNSSTAAPDEGLVVAGDDEGRDAHDALGGLAGHRHRGDGEASVGGRGHDLLEGRTDAGSGRGRGRRRRAGCPGRPSPGTARPRRSRPGSGGTSRASRQAERTSSACCIPRALTQVLSSAAVAWRASSVFPLPGGPDDADPARGRQRSGEASLSLLASETWGEHEENLSVQRHVNR